MNFLSFKLRGAASGVGCVYYVRISLRFSEMGCVWKWNLYTLVDSLFWVI